MTRGFVRFLLAGSILSTVAAPALAQENPRLSAIEAQIRALQGELARVRLYADGTRQVMLRRKVTTDTLPGLST
jgi:hypothetical protein